MMERPSSVTVRVPATSANLGPGFDTLGMAFSLYNTFTFTLAARTEVLGCEMRFCNERNLALVAFRAACEEAGVPPPPVRMTVQSDVPVSRGLGSSATMLVGGVVGACRLLCLPLDEMAMFALVNRLEGHPDNVAPALFGGLTAAMQEDGIPYVARHTVHPSYRFCALIPDFETSTKKARTALPKQLPYADAVYNVTHVTTTLSAFLNGDAALLRVSLKDALHQPYRAPLIHEYEQMRAMAEEAGAVGFFISGSGSTLMSVYTEDGFVERMTDAVKGLTHAWRVLALVPDTMGAYVTMQP